MPTPMPTPRPAPARRRVRPTRLHGCATPNASCARSPRRAAPPSPSRMGRRCSRRSTPSPCRSVRPSPPPRRCRLACCAAV
eukprot:6349577-Prymnesium_polylepis.1